MDVLKSGGVITTGFWDWISKKMGGKPISINGDIWSDPDFIHAIAEHHIRELAFESAAMLIANSISKCEFKTFRNGKEVRGLEYYLWNIEPNRNQNSSAFLQKLVHQLLRNNECLVVEINGDLLVADSFQRKPFAMLDDVFSGVTVGDLSFRRTFVASEVLYFQHNERSIKELTDSLYGSYVKLLQYDMKAFQRSRGIRGTMDISAMARGDPKYAETLQDMMNNRLKAFFTADNAVLPLHEGWKYTEIGSKTYANDTTRDIRALIDDISDFTAKGFGIPPALLRGDVAGIKDAMEMYLTVCVDPLADKLQEEIIRKRYGRTEYLAGNYLQIDTKAIKHVDLLSVSAAIDKLIGSGAFCVNDIRRLVGEQPIDEPWANEHFITRNYTTFMDAMKKLSGDGNAGGDADAE